MSVGGLMIYSSITGVSITGALAGEKPPPTQSDPGSGPFGGPSIAVPGGQWTAPPGGAHSFKGPHADLLNNLAGFAQTIYGLRISATTNGGHVADSYHYQGRAFDAVGSETNMRAFASYVYNNYKSQIAELIHNPGFSVKNGQDVPTTFWQSGVWAGHANHVHLAM